MKLEPVMWSVRRGCDNLEVFDKGSDSAARPPVTTAETVPVESIVGTIARCCDFDGCFQPLRRHLKKRMGRLREVFSDRYLPAVRLRQVADRYYVVDGHHRVALARERGMHAVDAIVTCRC